jgi:Leucine-rich repeat (LRR) protein
MGKRNIHVLHVGILLCALVLLTCEMGPEPNNLYPYGPLDIGDSLAVRAILDSNGLNNIPVRKVLVSFAQERIRILTIDSFGLKSFIFTKDFNKLDSLYSIELNFNPITQIAVPDTIQFKLHCDIGLMYNTLTSFPVELLKVKGDVNIFLENNSITTLPIEVIHAGPPNFFFEHNKICSLTDSAVIKWLDTTYGNWKSSQDCP